MPRRRCFFGRFRQASAITTALSPDNRMLMTTISSAATQNCGVKASTRFPPPPRHSREGGNPATFIKRHWVPACAGTTFSIAPTEAACPSPRGCVFFHVRDNFFGRLVEDRFQKVLPR